MTYLHQLCAVCQERAGIVDMLDDFHRTDNIERLRATLDQEVLNWCVSVCQGTFRFWG